MTQCNCVFFEWVEYTEQGMIMTTDEERVKLGFDSEQEILQQKFHRK
jgi:hypothetical protein